MHIALTSVAFVVAALCAGIMGFAIQRGATCTVAAIDEVVSRRGFQRLRSMLEASVWVAGGLAIAQSLGMLPAMPAGYAVGLGTTVGGALLLGIGAFVNRACVFGAIARLGSGEWSYVATPLGFYLGCVSLPLFYSMPTPEKLAHGSPVLQASSVVAFAFLALVTVRIVRAVLTGHGGATLPLRRLRAAAAAHFWSPHAATIVIGITFVAMFLLVGAWAYTDVLAELARGMSSNLAGRILLLVALFGGAALGGWTAERFRHIGVTFGQLLRCLAGGAMMGWGSLLIPGGNDGLVLVGMPLLWPYAWLAFLTMCISIAAAQLMAKALTSSKVLDAPSTER